MEVFGRHHLRDIEAAPSGGSSTLLHFALSPSPSAPAVRTVRAKLVIGADGPGSAVRNLQVRGKSQQQSLSGTRLKKESPRKETRRAVYAVRCDAVCV